MIFKARLTVNGTELAVAGASIDAPEGALGFGLQIALAQRHIGGVLAGASIEFAIGMKQTLAGAYEWVTILTGGKLLGRDYSMIWEDGAPGKPGDTVSFNALSPLADRWQLAPLRPLTIYNPLTVDTSSLQVDTANALRDGDTPNRILPVFEAIRGLGLRALLDRIYTSRAPYLAPGTGLGHGGSAGLEGTTGAGLGCGFNRVITNIPDFPIDRVDVTLEGGWHQAALSLIAEAYEPIYFELDNNLYIIDPGRGLPVSFPVRALSIDCMGEAQHIVAPGAIVNRIILSYEVRNPGLGTGGTPIITGFIPSERFIDDEPIITANTRQETTRKVREWLDLTTGLVGYTQEIETETRLYSLQSPPVLLSSDTIEVAYQGRLEMGHTKITSAWCPNPDVEWTELDADGNPKPVYSFMDGIHKETCRNEYTIDLANPGNSILKRCITETEGLVLVESGDNGKIYTPALDAAKSSLIKGDGSQTTTYRAIDTLTEELETTGYNQTKVIARIAHHLTDTIETPPPTISRTGTPSTFAGSTARVNNGLATIEELYGNAASIATYGARRAARLNVGQLNPTEGRLIVARRLARLANPRKRAPFVLRNKLDFLLHRGSVVKVPLRDRTYETSYMIISAKMNLRGLLTDNPSIDHAFEGIELG
jgi:hypothetical protein